MKKTKITALFLSCIMIIVPLFASLQGFDVDNFINFFISPPTANAAASGTCGKNLTWTLDDSGTLTISGTGGMDFYNWHDAPWIDNKDSIKRVVIEEGVTDITSGAFRYHTELTSVVLPGSLTVIGWTTFEGCTGLTEMTIPNGITTIGEWAFLSCTGLKSITIPDSVTCIVGEAFRGCTGLTNIIISDSVTGISKNAFYETAYYDDENNWENGLLYIGNHLISAKENMSGDIKIKDGTVSIADCIFEYCQELTSITIPNSVTSIGSYAFSGCTELTSITIPTGVTSIGDDAFEGCTGLTSITIPDSVTSIGNSAFDDTAYYNDESNWENDLLYIGNHLIAAKENVSGNIKIKDGTVCIAGGAFSGCTGLTSITIPNSVTSIGSYAFSRCTGLTNITIPGSVTSIEDYAFRGCTGLTSITIPNNVTSIGSYAFNGCTGLTSITIPDSVTSIKYAFYGCDNLTVKCYENSAAHTYAVENEIPFELIGTMEKDKNTGISVTYSKGTFGGDVSVKFEEKNVESVKLPEKYEKALVYDISFSLNGKEVQPNGKVTVKLPIPADYDTKSLKVYHEKSDGSLEEVEFKVVNGYVVFEASSFSNYVLIDSSSVLKADYTLGDINADGEVSAADARLALRTSVGLEKIEEGTSKFLAADVDNDNEITAADARLILRASVGLEKLA